MDALQQTSLNSLLPEPQVSLLRRRIEEDVDELSNLCQAIDMIKDEISLGDFNTNPDQLKLLKTQHRAAYLRFYSQARKIMRDAEQYIIENDKDDYAKINTAITLIDNDELYTMEAADITYRFIRRILKNSNLIELGKKSRVNELNNQIDLENI